jgi:transglutaminase-like putative cysteine protease
VNERSFGWGAENTSSIEHWLLRAGRWVADRWRPHLGWAVLAICVMLTMLPAALLWENRWLRSGALIGRLYAAGPLAILVFWVVAGWRRPLVGEHKVLRIAVQGVGLLLLTLLIGSQLLASWLPGPMLVWRAAVSGSWPILLAHAGEALQRVGVRYALWWQGVQNNTAGRDDLVFFGFALVIVWLLALLTAWLTRRFRNGLLAATPILWVVGLVMLYSAVDRWLIVAGVALALLLHLSLDQLALVERWQALKLDYSPLALTERAFVSLGMIALVVGAAAIMPNLYSVQIAGRYYALIAPFNQRMEAIGKRAFPELTGVNPWAGGGAAGGLPNQFLLRGGPTLNERTVMRVRTSDAPRSFDDAPLAHNLRGATYAAYDGRGWQNPASVVRTELAAEQPWALLSDAGRRTLLQNISLTSASRILFAAGEPLAPSVGYQAEERFAGDLVALYSNERSYTVASLVPALSETELNALPGWSAERPLPADHFVFLDLPASVTPRTRALAAEVTADAATLYAQATAIERYLRTFPYDLTVSAPPPEVADVADYFLFELQRGYCDYYATAFVVLARAAGIPARFATGFTNGSWQPQEQVWVVAEANAHSWPEVYFPDVGWIPFEPTAGLPELARIGVVRTTGAPSSPPTVEPLSPSPFPFDDRWLWLLAPVALLLAAGGLLLRRWRLSREDPWGALLQWGGQLGRAPEAGETVLEYGEALSSYIQTSRQDEPEVRRLVGREVRAISQEVSTLHYAPESRRPSLRVQILERWRRLRGYVKQVKR